jgi:hypothetical protein
MQQFFFFLGLLCCIACHSETPPSTANNTNFNTLNQDTLRAILYLKDSVFESSLDAYVEATILNRSNKIYTIKAAVLQQAILAVQVLDAKGKLVPSIPPSVPLSEKNSAYITIKPMEAFITTYDLHIFDYLLASGKYLIKMKNMPSKERSKNKVNVLRHLFGLKISKKSDV